MQTQKKKERAKSNQQYLLDLRLKTSICKAYLLHNLHPPSNLLALQCSYPSTCPKSSSLFWTSTRINFPRLYSLLPEDIDTATSKSPFEAPFKWPSALGQHF